MSSISSLLTIITALLAVQLASAYYPCFTDSQCEQYLDVLRCDGRKCVCKEGFGQTEIETPKSYQIQCSKPNTVLIVVVVLVVVGVAAGTGVGVYFMKRKRMGCFA